MHVRTYLRSKFSAIWQQRFDAEDQILAALNSYGFTGKAIISYLINQTFFPVLKKIIFNGFVGKSPGFVRNNSNWNE